MTHKPSTSSEQSHGANDSSMELALALVQQLDSLRTAGVSSLTSIENEPMPVTATVEVNAETPVESPYDYRPQPTENHVTNIVAERPEPASVATLQDTRNEDAMPPTKSKTSSTSSGMSLAESEAAMQVISREVSKCTLCQELSSERNKTVFGVGNPQARLCFLGEAPGADEDRTGEPFVGRAGKLLTKIIEACTLSRDDVYILNVIKCRPPGNRNPATEEVSNCRDFFERQLAVIEPEYICCLGAVAAQNLLDTQVTIGKLRGQFHDWNGIKVLATYHPAYLLRNPPAKAEVWKDMQFLMADMGIKLPKS